MAKIIYTITDEAPALATRSFLPIVSSFVEPYGVTIDTKNISLAARILSAFPDFLSEDQKVEDALEQKKVEKDKALTDAGLEPTEGTQGDAVAEASTNMDSMDVDAATAQLADSSQAPAPVNVVNQGQQGPASTGDAPAVAVLPGSLRSADSTIQRYQDKRFVI